MIVVFGRAYPLGVISICSPNKDNLTYLIHIQRCLEGGRKLENSEGTRADMKRTQIDSKLRVTPATWLFYFSEERSPCSYEAETLLTNFEFSNNLQFNIASTNTR